MWVRFESFIGVWGVLNAFTQVVMELSMFGRSTISVVSPSGGALMMMMVNVIIIMYTSAAHHMNIWWGNIVRCYAINAHQYFEVWNNFFSICFRSTRSERKMRSHGMCGQGKRAICDGSDLWPDAKRLFVLQFSTENTEIWSIRTISLPALQFKASSDFRLIQFECETSKWNGIRCWEFPVSPKRSSADEDGRMECDENFAIHFLVTSISSAGHCLPGTLTKNGTRSAAFFRLNSSFIHPLGEGNQTKQKYVFSLAPKG